MTIDEIRDNFALLDDWDDRYRYVIELGRTLDPMPEEDSEDLTNAEILAAVPTGHMNDIVRHLTAAKCSAMLPTSGTTIRPMKTLARPAQITPWVAARRSFFWRSARARKASSCRPRTGELGPADAADQPVVGSGFEFRRRRRAGIGRVRAARREAAAPAGAVEARLTPGPPPSRGGSVG